MNDYNTNMTMNKNAPASWCVLPWSRISIKPNGVYRLCCNSDPNIKTDNSVLTDKHGNPLHVNKTDWKSVINSDLMKSVRKNMLAGKWPAECVNCQMRYESGMPAPNISASSALAAVVESENYPGYVKTQALTRPDGSIPLSHFPFSDLDLRFGNLCNLKCVMCGPRASNQWYDDYRLIWGTDYFSDQKETIQLKPDINGKWKPKRDTFNWSDDPHLWSQIENYINNFRTIYITGGEPLLIKAHYKFLKKCIESGVAEKITLEYNSNITYIPEKVWEFWRHFNEVNIGMSLDGYGAINDLIRFPSKWSDIEKNLTKFDTAKGNFCLHIAMTVSVLNILHLPEFIEYIMCKNYKQIGIQEKYCIMFHHPVHFPKHLDINILEDNFKKEIKTYFDSFKKKISNFNWQSTYGISHLHSWEQKIRVAFKILDSCLKYMEKIHYTKEDLVKERKKFIYYMDKLDELRKTNWSKIVPELYESTLTWKKLR